MRSCESILLTFDNYISGQGLSENYRYTLNLFLNDFFFFLRKRDKEDVRAITGEDVQDFIKYMIYEARTRQGKPFKGKTVNLYVKALRRFFKFLVRNEMILINPMEETAMIKESENPRRIFTVDEVNRFLDGIDPEQENGSRDRALFELLYSSGLRIGEALALNLEQLDLHERVLLVKAGKGEKDRFVPFSETAFYFLHSYIEGDRTRQVVKVKREDRNALFLTAVGRVSYTTITTRFRKLLDRSGIERNNITLHSIRHSTATHLLEAGAGVRYVQELLGHENIKTTVKYTHLLLENLKKAYKSAHPRENEYYEEIDEEYLADVEQLEKAIRKCKEERIRYRMGRKKKKRNL